MSEIKMSLDTVNKLIEDKRYHLKNTLESMTSLIEDIIISIEKEEDYDNIRLLLSPLEEYHKEINTITYGISMLTVRQCYLEECDQQIMNEIGEK